MLGNVGLWVVGLQLGLVVGLDNGVGVRPPLGWNSWNTFKGELTEEVVRDTAAHLLSSGLAAKGYIYVNLDDTCE
jgi:alpha-galactosidase